jgi:hypothetical protein
MTISIDELLAALQNPEKTGTLENNKETWSRIGNRDNFEELSLSKSELDSFLEEWMSDNPYNSI